MTEEFDPWTTAKEGIERLYEVEALMGELREWVMNSGKTEAAVTAIVAQSIQLLSDPPSEAHRDHVMLRASMVVKVFFGIDVTDPDLMNRVLSRIGISPEIKEEQMEALSKVIDQMIAKEDDDA